MDAQSFTRLLAPLGIAVFVVGWVLAVAAFFVIGTERCATVEIPLAGAFEACQDTTASAVVMLTAIGFAATVGAIFLFALRYFLGVLSQIEENTRK
jgi:hypothetical protein